MLHISVGFTHFSRIENAVVVVEQWRKTQPLPAKHLTNVFNWLKKSSCFLQLACLYSYQNCGAFQCQDTWWVDTSQKNRGLISVCLGSITFSAIKVAMLSIALINLHLVKATVSSCKFAFKKMSINQLHEVIIISKHLNSSLLVLKSDAIVQFATLSKLLTSLAKKISLHLSNESVFLRHILTRGHCNTYSYRYFSFGENNVWSWKKWCVGVRFWCTLFLRGLLLIRWFELF